MPGYGWKRAAAVGLVAWVAACGGKHRVSPSSGSGASGQVGEAPIGASGGSGDQAPGGSGGAQGGVAAAASGGGAGAAAYGGASGGESPVLDAGAPGTAGAPDVDMPIDAYAPRSGPFAMLVYSRTKDFRHPSVEAGEKMLRRIADRQGFDVVVTASNELFTPEGLAQFELVYFNNTSGAVLSEAEHQAYEDWMRARHGAFAGHHAAADTEFGWPFFREVIGQHSSGHSAQGVIDSVVFEPGTSSHRAVDGLPSPWLRQDEWLRFDAHREWSAKPGFRVLGRKQSDGEPIAWTREWGNFRAFYTGLGHDQATFDDPEFEQHVTGGVLWAVRREHLVVSE